MAVGTRGCGKPGKREETEREIDAIPAEEIYVFTVDGENVAGEAREGQPLARCSARFYAFNSPIALTAFGAQDCCRTAFAQALGSCRRYERLLSRTLPHSDIAAIGASGGEWVGIDADTADVLRAGMRFCADSEGVLDITMGSATCLWDFHTGKMPDENEAAAAVQDVDWRCLELREVDAGERSAQGSPGARWEARLGNPAARLDVGAIAKGWIADRLAAGLMAAGLASFVVDLGGNILARGVKPDGSPWRMGLRDPLHPEGLIAAIELENQAAVTSGTYERCIVRDGRAYHHILNPATGYPVQTDLLSATIIAADALTAEGYSTTVLALGRARGEAFIAARPAIQGAVLVDATGAIV